MSVAVDLVLVLRRGSRMGGGGPAIEAYDQSPAVLVVVGYWLGCCWVVVPQVLPVVSVVMVLVGWVGPLWAAGCLVPSRPGFGGLVRQLWALPVLGLVLVGWWLLQAVVSVLVGQLPGGLLRWAAGCLVPGRPGFGGLARQLWALPVLG